MEGCEYGKAEDPGNLQFDWLEVQLNMYRERGMQVSSSTTDNIQSRPNNIIGLDVWPYPSNPGQLLPRMCMLLQFPPILQIPHTSQYYQYGELALR